ncbi:MAG: glycosyltransferase family 4 protein [Halobacteriota archaeon]
MDGGGGEEATRIAYVMDAIYPYNMGGADKRLWELARKLAQDEEHEVHIFGMKWWEGPDTIVTDNVHLHGVCKVRELYGKNGVRSITEAIIYSLKVIPPLLRAQCDVIDCNQFPYFPCFSGKIVSIIKRKPLVITWLEVWDTYWCSYLGPIGGGIGRIIERLTMRLPDSIVAVSNKTKEDLVRCDVDHRRIDVIPVGVDLEHIACIQPSLKGADVLFAGRLIYEKRVDLLLNALALAKEEIPTISCMIVGDGPERATLEAQARQLGLEENVTFMGFVKQDGLIAHMKSSKVFVLPSEREGFGLVIVEANACRLPVISIRHEMSATRELVEDEINGFLVSTASPEEIAKVIVRIVQDDVLRARLAENGQEMAKRFAWSDISRSVIDTYKRVIH